MSVLLHRAIVATAPRSTFRVRLGALAVRSVDGANNILFDPRGPDAIDGGFHAWIEDDAGTVTDASVCATLRANDYRVDADELLVLEARRGAFNDVRLDYEELPELQLLGLGEWAELLDAMLAHVLTGAILRPGRVELDVGWRAPDGAGDRT